METTEVKSQSTPQLSGKMVKLKPSDQSTIEAVLVPIEYATQSLTIKNMLDDLQDAEGAEVPLHNITEPILQKVIEFCKHSFENPVSTVTNEKLELAKELDEWEKSFTELEVKVLLDVIIAANYLDIKPLLNLGCKTVAMQLVGKTSDEIRQFFGVEREFTPQEVEDVRRELQARAIGAK